MDVKKEIIENLRKIQIGIIRRSYQNEAGQSPLHGQGRVLGILLENSRISRSELGEQIHMSRAAMAELLGKMEKKGLIERIQSPADKRRIDIKLTPEGRKAARHSELAAALLPGMLDCLDPDELEQFNSYLERIIEHNSCSGCMGPEYCRRDYKKYGHDRPNPDYCKYAELFPF